MRFGTIACIAALALGMLLAPLAADALAPAKVPRIGFLWSLSPTDLPHLREAFRQGLRELGYVEGQTIAIEYRFAEGRPERLPALAAELVRLKVDVIVTGPPPAPEAAKQGHRDAAGRHQTDRKGGVPQVKHLAEDVGQPAEHPA